MLLDPAAPGALSWSPIEPGHVALWRLMIDQRHQRQGHGRAALELVCAHVRDTLKAHGLISSFIPGEQGPEAFYTAYGFRRTGRMRANGTEIEILLDL